MDQVSEALVVMANANAVLRSVRLRAEAGDFVREVDASRRDSDAVRARIRELLGK